MIIEVLRRTFVVGHSKLHDDAEYYVIHVLPFSTLDVNGYEVITRHKMSIHHGGKFIDSYNEPPII
jgi:hypothetical protein